MAKPRADSPKIRFVQPSGEPTVVLTSKGGRVRLKGLLRNDGTEPVNVAGATISARIPGEGAVLAVAEPIPPILLLPSESRPTSLKARLDPLTPPGEYDAEVVIEGVPHDAKLLVSEQVSLQLSKSEVVVEAGSDGAAHLVATNTGNVPLEVRRIGPVELVPDQPRPTLLQRLGVIPREHVERTYLAPTEDEAPTVSARTDSAVALAPGESKPLELSVTVEGPLRPGLRYRGTAPVHTTDLTFVVTPNQDDLALPAVAESPTAPPGTAEPPAGRPAPTSRQKRRKK
jgi:hypothetical protein